MELQLSMLSFKTNPFNDAN